MNKYGASQFLDLKDNVLRFVTIYNDMKNKVTKMWKLKTDVLQYIRYLKNNGAPEYICDEITDALNQFY